MGYYVSHMFGIRTGGVFAGDSDMDAVKAAVQKVVLQMRVEDLRVDLDDESGDASHCLSAELVAHKGSYVVLAGVFNYWNFDEGEEFARRLSHELETSVMHMAWDEEQDTVRCQVWDQGQTILEHQENPIGKVLRRVT